ncbi:Jerky -like [Araneus ventricosus]|uniref:Jerky-like n=1 Tax=Araneus ventricosus TaxID=182803 RepID=A0A4Y2H930_ARAVE|nr:Jerky -like [Araneus ventricosus]
MKSNNLQQRALLLLDNCPGHPSAEELCTDDGDISAMFSPPNTTALIQPMDQNVIQNIKLGYRKLLLTNILNDPVHNEDLEKTLKNVNLKDVVFSLANCWASVSTFLINKSWKNLLPNFIDSEVEENVQTEEIQLASLINQLQNTTPMSNTEALQWAAEADDSLARNEILTDDEIIRTVTAEDDDDDDINPVNPIKISHSEAVAALNTSLQWAEEQNFEAHEMMLLRRLRDRAFELKIGMSAQKKKNH